MMAFVPNLESLSVTANPASDEKGEDLKKEVLILLGSKLRLLKKINKDIVTKEDRKEARKELIVREK